MINPDEIKAGMVIGITDALILRDAVKRLNALEVELLVLRKARKGWKLVPVEPTQEMLHASYREASVYSPSAYRAMLAAAPEPE